MDISLIILILALLYCSYLYKHNINLYLECSNLKTQNEYISKQNDKILKELSILVSYIQERDECKEKLVDVIGFNAEQMLINRETSEKTLEEEVQEFDNSLPSHLDSLVLDL